MAVHPLVEKVPKARPPIAELIGFTVEEIGAGRAVGSLQSGPATRQPDGNVARRRPVRPVGRRDGHGVRNDPGAR
jgi:hypothetical protein